MGGQLCASPAFDPGSNLNHLKILLASPTFRAGPVHGHIAPGGSGRNAMLGVAACLIVYPATYEAHPGFVIAHVVLTFAWNRMN